MAPQNPAIHEAQLWLPDARCCLPTDYFITTSAVFRTKLHLPSDKFPWITPKRNLCIAVWAAVDAKRQELWHLKVVKQTNETSLLASCNHETLPTHPPASPVSADQPSQHSNWSTAKAAEVSRNPKLHLVQCTYQEMPLGRKIKKA